MYQVKYTILEHLLLNPSLPSKKMYLCKSNSIRRFNYTLVTVNCQLTMSEYTNVEHPFLEKKPFHLKSVILQTEKRE